ncbi:MAG: hypothetical protein ACKVOO_10870 [Burkholderiaceae bacterium]
MAITAPTTIAANSQPAPDASDGSTFSLRATAFADYLYNTAVAGMNAATANAYNNALEAYNNAIAAATAAAAAGAIAWVSGTTYAIGNVRYSLVNFQSYRRTTAGAGTTDPSLDGANWTRIVLGATLQIPQSVRSSNTILAAADLASLIDCTGTFAQTFTAAATLAVGWYCYIRNNGTGTITLTPNGAETIDGLATLTLAPGDVRIVLVNAAGTGLVTVPVRGCAPAFGAISSATVLQSFNCQSFLAACTISSTRAFVLGLNASNQPVVYLVSNAGALIATSAVLDTNTRTSGSVPSIIKINSTDALVLWSYGNTTVLAMIVRDAGASVTLGALATVATGLSTSTAQSLAFLTATKIVAAYSGTSGSAFANVLTITGTSIAVGAQLTITLLTGVYPYLRIAPLVTGAGGRLLLTYGAALNAVYAVQLAEASNVLTASDHKQLLNTAYQGSSSAEATHDIAQLSADNVMIAGGGAGTLGVPTKITLATRAGTLMQEGGGAIFVDGGNGASRAHRLAQLNSSTYLHLAAQGTASNPITLRAIKVANQQISVATVSPRIADADTFEVAVFDAATALIAYRDASNSNYQTIKTVALGSVT